MNDYFKPHYRRWFYNFYTFRSNIGSTFRWLKWTWQRAFRGYADCDSWNIDSYFNVTILPLLKRFRKNHCGYPASTTPEKWESILDRMIEAFEAADRIESLNYDDMNDWKKDMKLFQKDGKLFIKHFLALWS